MLSNKLRQAILERDNYMCRYCGGTSNLQIDHVYPRSKGGGDEIRNLVVACQPCNLKKLDRVGIFPYPIGHFKQGLFARLKMNLFGVRVEDVTQDIAEESPSVAYIAPGDIFPEVPESHVLLGFDSRTVRWLCSLVARDNMLHKRDYGNMPTPFPANEMSVPLREFGGGVPLVRFQEICVRRGIVAGWGKAFPARALVRDENVIYDAVVNEQ